MDGYYQDPDYLTSDEREENRGYLWDYDKEQARIRREIRGEANDDVQRMRR